MSHVRRIVGFAAVPASTMISTLLLLPIVSSRFGPDGWSAVLLGQSIGAFISVIAGLGWQIVGGNMVARTQSHHERKIIYAESLKSRLAILAIAILPGALLAYYLLPSHGFEATLFMIGTTLNCLNASWYFSGTAQPRMILINEGLVRLAGYVLSIIAVLLLNLLWIYGAILILAGCFMAFANYRTILGGSVSSAWSDSRRTWPVVRGQFSGMLSRFFQAGQLYAGTPIVAFFSPTALAVYSALDTVQKSVGNATAFYPQAFAWWVGSVDYATKLLRVRRLALITAALGLIGLLLWSAVGQSLMHALFSGKIHISLFLSFINGVCIATFFVSKSLGLLGMIPLGLHDRYYFLSSIASVLSVIVFIFGVLLFDIAFGLGAVATVGVGLSSVLFISVIRGSRQWRGN